MHPSAFQSTIGEPFIEIATIESTNNYAMAQVQNDAATHGTAWFAHMQTNGRGQRGKAWETEARQNIILSILLDTSTFDLGRSFEISIAIAVAAHQLFSSYAGDETKIKWPNDIYWRDRKAGGILIDNIVRGTKWQWSVTGIGMNINQAVFNDAIMNAVSLKQITGKTHDRVALAKQLCEKIQTQYELILAGKFKEILDVYNSVLFMRGAEVRFKKGNQAFTAIVDKVNQWNQLEISNGPQDHFDFGEVEWV
ncbi:MAG: biotin/acetyl-CoA-carboxylase ligase [Chitinophagaceae bacterium]|nr:biotin/acetyl-CoA-carboxylase ligase [Chitinophagaceae bacterium]